MSQSQPQVTPPFPQHSVQMPTLSQATNTWQLLADASFERQAKIASYNTQPDKAGSNEESHFTFPIFDRFNIKNGKQPVQDLTNFDAVKFDILWNKVSEFFTSKIQRRARSQVSAYL